MDVQNNLDTGYLPGLDSVETRDSRYGMILLTMGGMAFGQLYMLVWGCLRYREYLDARIPVLVGAVILLLLFALVRLMLGYVHFKTDADGFTMRGPVRKRFIRWTDIIEASSREMPGSGTALVLRIYGENVKLATRGLGGGNWSSDLIVASVRQHLQSEGKADRIKLTPSMLALWQPVPDDVPPELQWGKPPTRGIRATGILGVLLLPAMVLPLWMIGGGGVVWMVWLTGMTAAALGTVVGLLTPDILRTARRVAVTPDGLEAELLFRKVHIPWSDVSGYAWQNGSISILSASRRLEVRVPYGPRRKDTEPLVLAIIRYLRSAPNPQAIGIPRGGK